MKDSNQKHPYQKPKIGNKNPKKKKKKTKKEKDEGFTLGSLLSNPIAKGIGTSLIGGVGGSAIAAYAGKYSLVTGLAINLIGQNAGKHSEWFTALGSGTIGYGFANIGKDKTDPEHQTAAGRLKQLKNNYLIMLRQKLDEDNATPPETEAKAPPVPSPPLDGIPSATPNEEMPKQDVQQTHDVFDEIDTSLEELANKYLSSMPEQEEKPEKESPQPEEETNEEDPNLDLI